MISRNSPSLPALARSLAFGIALCSVQPIAQGFSSESFPSPDTANRSEGAAGTNLTRLSEAMRAQNGRLRALLQEREQQLRAVRAQLRQAAVPPVRAEPTPNYPLFIATP